MTGRPRQPNGALCVLKCHNTLASPGSQWSGIRPCDPEVMQYSLFQAACILDVREQGNAMLLAVGVMHLHCPHARSASKV